ncbi:MAG: type II secretion system F family protein [Syntrophales bacterium LBB04]|nr:type II secretion system F family protein [Syntrophales bacterium LBB04]
MATYSYQAIDGSGKTVKGALDAYSLEAAEESISLGGLIPVTIAEVKAKEGSSGGAVRKSGTTVKPSDLILFSKQFRSMFRAGIPLLRLLEVLEQQSENRTLKRISLAMMEDIKQGSSLRDAMAKHPAVFSPLYCGMINAGEVSGNVPEVLDRLTYILEHENKVKADIKSALQYPKVVVVALGIAFFVLLGFVIPKFAMIFEKARLALPLPTRIAIAMHHYLIGYWYILLAGVAGFIVGLKLYIKTSNGLFVKDSFLLRLPIIGPLFIKSAMSRFSSIFAILISSGIPVMDTMKILADTIGNEAISRAFKAISTQMEEGKGISGPLAKAKLFTPMVVNMVAIGEESGNLEGMLQEITKHYDEEVSHAVSRLADLITPVLTVALAGIVAFFALAIFMPMWDLTKMVKH